MRVSNLINFRRTLLMPDIHPLVVNGTTRKSNNEKAVFTTYLRVKNKRMDLESLKK